MTVGHGRRQVVGVLSMPHTFGFDWKSQISITISKEKLPINVSPNIYFQFHSGETFHIVEWITNQMKC